MLAQIREAEGQLTLAWARVRRGWSRTVAQARGYRYAGEQATHAEQLRETEVSLSLMATADPNDPDQLRMASDIEHGSENRLAVLLGKPRLTLEEKRERDAIQAALGMRRQAFDAPPVIVQREAAPAPMGLLGSLGGGPLTGILMSPLTWVAVAFMVPGAWGMVQTARLNHAKHELTETRDDLAQAVRERNDWHDRASRYAQAVADARETAEQTAQALNQERRRQQAAARRERERNRDVQNILAGSGSADPPPWDERLRNDQPVQERPGSGD